MSPTRRPPADAGAMLEHLNLHIALLDMEGNVVHTNRQWRQFAEENGGGESVGLNYLQVSPPEVQSGVQGVIDGHTERWSHEYPCHSPHQRRFFRMDVTRTELADGQGYVMVTHQDITQQKLVEFQAQALNAALAAQSQLMAQYTFATSHTLKEPLRRLTATSSGLQELAGAPGDTERLRKYAEINMKAAQQMSALVDSMAQYATLGHPPGEGHDRYDIRAALQREAAEHNLQAVIGDLPPVVLGERHGAVLIHNLIVNFRELRAPNELLNVQGRRDGDFVHIHFRLSKLDVEQASDALNLFQTGGKAALGLSSLLTAQYGGRLWTESGGQDIGLHLTLPAWREEGGHTEPQDR